EKKALEIKKELECYAYDCNQEAKNCKSELDWTQEIYSECLKDLTKETIKKANFEIRNFTIPKYSSKSFYNLYYDDYLNQWIYYGNYSREDECYIIGMNIFGEEYIIHNTYSYGDFTIRNEGNKDLEVQFLCQI
ncbi:MAG: hypothetical protein AABW56_01480, partial [Nanoarchaeota archaeon]